MTEMFERSVLRKQAPLLGLILFMAVVFGCQVVLGPHWYENLMVVPARIAESWDRLRTGEFSVSDGAPLVALLTSAFLHGDVQHLLLNMLFLWIFAALIAELLGARWMFLIFTVSAISGSIFHTLVNAEDLVPMLGASGAVMGFEGAYLGLAVRWRLPDPHVWPMARPIPPAQLAALAVIGIVMDVTGLMNQGESNIAFGAHVGGFLAGLFITSFIAPRPASP